MSVRRITTWLAPVALLALGFLVIDAWGGAGEPVSVAADAGAIRASRAESVRANSCSESSELREAERTVVAPTRACAIEVRCTASDGASAVEGLAVFLQPASASASARIFARSDAEGRCFFEQLVPGRYAVADRFLTAGIQRVELQPGERATVGLRLTRSVRITGYVEDEFGRRIGGAAIEVLPREANAAPVPVTVSAVDGTFEVAHAPRRCALGARRSGYDSSAYLRIDGQAGAHVEVRLVLPAGGAVVEGTVEDRSGQPVAGALVSFGERVRGFRLVDSPAGSRGVACQRVEVRSDPAGRFRAVGLPVGELQVTARSRTSAPYVEGVQLRAHEVCVLRIRLDEGGTCRGVVHDEAGAAVAGVEVGFTGEQGSLPRTQRSDVGGRFELQALPWGAQRLWARHLEAGVAAIEIQVRPGEAVLWNPVLDAGPTLRVRVVDEQGEGLADLPIHVASEAEGVRAGWWFRQLVTGADGRAQVRNCPAGETVVVDLSQGVPRRIRWEGVDPFAQEELLIRVPSRAARTAQGGGRILDAAYRPIADAEVLFTMPGSGIAPARSRADGETGSFETGPVVPGEYTVLVRAPGFVDRRVEWVLRANTRSDLGTVLLERVGEATLQGPPRPSTTRSPSGGR